MVLSDAQVLAPDIGQDGSQSCSKGVRNETLAGGGVVGCREPLLAAPDSAHPPSTRQRAGENVKGVRNERLDDSKRDGSMPFLGLDVERRRGRILCLKVDVTASCEEQLRDSLMPLKGRKNRDRAFFHVAQQSFLKVRRKALVWGSREGSSSLFSSPREDAKTRSRGTEAKLNVSALAMLTHFT